MSQQELLTKLAACLEVSGIPYMMTGSIASSLHGEPRSTHDIDVIVQIKKTDVTKLIAAFPAPRYYLDKIDAEQAINERTMFNLIDSSEGDKVDFWLLTDEPFDRSRFGRKKVEEVFGTRLYVSSPEDTIVAKLRWARLSGGSEKQFGDALHVYEVQHQDLDLSYLEKWAVNLGLSELWERLKSEAQVL
jgi:hypothetical protein